MSLIFFIIAILCISANSSTVLQTTTNIDTTTEVSTTTTESLNVTLDSCDNNDMNCTQLNNTSSSESKKTNNTNTNATKTNNTSETGKNKKEYHRDTSIICTCNLQGNICDINCCCDPDCSATDKAIFKYCEIDENRFFDDRYCNYIKHIYVNNTPFEWEVNQDGLFCVISSNLPKSHLVQKEKPITLIEAVKSTKLFWAQDTQQQLLLKHELQLGSRNYAFGDPIMIVKNDSSIDLLHMPKNVLTQPCVYKTDMVFLKDDKSVCSQVNIDDGNDMLSLPSFFQGFKIIGKPKLVNSTKAKGNLYQNCPRNVCVEVEPKLCDIHLNNCSKINNTNIKFQCSYQLRSNLNECQNAVKKIHYKFYHNGTNGLDKIEVLAVLSNFSYKFGGEDFQFVQDFSLEFLWINRTRNFSDIFSGNPGYIIGKPVLVARKLNGSVIERNSSRFTDNFLVFPENIQGQCIRNETYNVPLEFGYNILTKCLWQKMMTFNKTQNASDMCGTIQKAIFDLWGVPNQANASLVFGLFGNALATTEEDWSEVIYKTKPLFNSTQGNFTNKNSTLMCFNLSTLINVDIFYSRVDLKTVLNQNKILGIVFGFNNILNETILLQKKNQNLSLVVSFEVISQVSFHDITSKKERKFVGPPSLDIRLPYDFFYPFIKVGSGASLIRTNILILIIVVVLSELIQ